MGNWQSVAVVSAAYGSYAFYKKYKRISVAHVPGPAAESFLLGNYRELFQSQAGEADSKWQAEYGDVVRIKSILGEDVLLLSDPKALQYIFQTSGYTFQKLPERAEISRLVLGYGIVWADGEVHKRHRKVMLPGFGGPVAKACVPIFAHDARRLSDRWLSMIEVSSSDSTIIDIPPWMSRATLDSIGKTAFDYNFETMQDDKSELAKVYMNVVYDSMGSPSTDTIFTQAFVRYLPSSLRTWLGDHSSNPKLQRLREMSKMTDDVARELVGRKMEALEAGKAKKDILTLLVQANASENEKYKLSEVELVSQMRTILLAGHETTASTLDWMLLELARHPDIQQKLRKEIHDMQDIVSQRSGDSESEFTAKDFDNMPYMSAFLRESLRFNPAAALMFRRPMKDEVIPLSKPFINLQGKEITKLPVAANQRIIVSINGYNRNKQVFGEDAHIFDPSRWLDQRVKTEAPVGVIGNLMSFSSGVRSCIGWKFAVLEVQTFLVELVGKFEFAMTPEAETIERNLAGAITPIVKGQEHRGASVPLRVRVASRSAGNF